MGKKQLLWPDERVELLKKYLKLGLFYIDIAHKLGTTKNAVSGKVNRLGLSATKNVKKSRQTSRKRKVSKKVIRRSSIPVGVFKKPEQPIKDIIIPDPGPLATGEKYTVLTLPLRNACRFPIGHPGCDDFHFCGHETCEKSSGSYCSYHAEIAYRPEIKRKRSTYLQRRR